MPKALPLTQFEPRWLSTGTPSGHGVGSRYQMGVSFRCPTHGGKCRLDFWFENPADGDGPVLGQKLWHRTGAAMSELSVEPAFRDLSVSPRSGLSAPLRVPGHWAGWIVQGDVQTASAHPEDETDPGVF